MASLLVIGFSVAVSSTVKAGSPLRVADVQVTIVDAGGTKNIPLLVGERMASTVRIIAMERMEGRSLPFSDIDIEREADIIRQVFNRILVGYTVTKVEVVADEITGVKLYLEPWSDTIQSVDIATVVEGMPAHAESLVRKDLAGVERVFVEALVGLPLASTDWANGAIKKALNAYMEVNLPEFRADFDINPDYVTKISLTIYPRLPVVRTIDLFMRSDTVPNMYLLSRRTLLEHRANKLVGVPVAFVARHKATFEAELANYLDNLPDFRTLRLTSKISIMPAEQLEIMSRTDSAIYRLRLTGWLDIAREDKGKRTNDNDLAFRLHAGRMISPKEELFVDMELIPENVKFTWRLGYTGEIIPNLRGEVRYNLRHHDWEIGSTVNLNRRWDIRYDYYRYQRRGEVGLKYKLHDFMAVEYVHDNEDGWLRLIGNF